jgi:predicted GIY-YIG superfamily endonuclease
MNYCYILYIPGTNRTYIGATNDPAHRLRQHNGELKGGAKATKGNRWTQAFYVSGFPDWRATLQFEWAWKYNSRGKPGLKGKIAGLKKLLAKPRATTNALPFSLWPNPIVFHVTDAQTPPLQKIETAGFLLEPQHPPMSSVTLSAFNALTAKVNDLATELSLLKHAVTSMQKAPIGEPKVKRAKKAPKSADTPKKPLSPYMRFCQAKRKEAGDTKLNVTELGAQWKALSEDQQKAYKA